MYVCVHACIHMEKLSFCVCHFESRTRNSIKHGDKIEHNNNNSNSSRAKK